MDRFDITVVGAGPVGLTAALLLARGGATVAVVEAASAPTDLPRAISIADETFRVMDRLGLAETLTAESHMDTGARYYGLGGRLLAETRPVPSQSGFPAKSQFDQPVMEGLLWDLAHETPGITMFVGHRAENLQQGATNVTTRIRSSVSGEEHVLRSAWMIGADGGKSFTRDALGVRLVGSTQQERWIVIDLLNVPGEPEPFAEFHGNGKRPLVFVPGISGRLRLEYMLFPHEDSEQMTAMPQILALSRPYFAGVTEDDVRRATVYVAHQRLAQRYRSGRAFLIGDAAHLMPPFSGQGLNAGIRDASNLAWKLLDVLRGVGSDALLDSYETERRTHGKKMVRVSQRTGAVVMATGWWKPRLRDVTLKLIRVVPPVHRYLTSMRFITPPNYADGVAVAPSSRVPAQSASRVGLSVSQPEVTDAEGELTRLDRVLGDGWNLLRLSSVGQSSDTQLHPFWRGIGITAVTVTASPSGSGRAGVVIDRTGLIAPAGDFPDHLMLVRPDRYVAAAFLDDEEAAVIQAMRAYLSDEKPVSLDQEN